MGLTATFSTADIRASFEKAKAQFHAAALRTLNYLGQQCVAHARTNGTYRDGTGNLRGSLGYIILYNGVIQKKNITGTQIGSSEAEKALVLLIPLYPSGYVLIVIAGMNYAAKVESRGRDVLTSAEQYAEVELPGLLLELKRGMSKLVA